MTSDGFHAKWCFRRKNAMKISEALNKAISDSPNGHPSHRYIVKPDKRWICYEVVKYLKP